MKQLEFIRVLYRNERQNIIFDMSLCEFLGVSQKKCLVVYKDGDGFVFLRTMDITYKSDRQYVGGGEYRDYDYPDEIDLRDRLVNSDDMVSYANLRAENQRLKDLLKNIQNLAKIS